MSGAQPEAFLARAKPAFDRLLRGYGFRPVTEHRDDAAFGSGYVLYRHRARWVRLVWDGREGAAWVEVGEGDSPTAVPGWQDLESLVTGRPARISRGGGAARLDALRLAATAYLGR